jgi:hypothetical protein
MVIDGVPFLKMGGSFHGYVTNNQMVILVKPGCKHEAVKLGLIETAMSLAIFHGVCLIQFMD